MDRTLKVFASTGHLFGEFVFHYDQVRQAAVHWTEYRRLYSDEEEDENKSVYPGMDMDTHLPFMHFNSIDEIRAYDIGIVKQEMGRDMTDPKGYTYVYESQPVLQRYVVENHIGCIGMVNIVYSFIENTKDIKFLSATNPRFDVDLASGSLETNLECILKIPVYRERDEPGEISPYDLKKLPAWY